MMATALVPLGAGAARATAAEPVALLVDRDGVLHVTNVPADPRYRGLVGAPGPGAPARRPPTPAAGRPHAVEIEEASRRHGLSPALVEAVIRAESGFDPNAVSPKGAGGLMQLMPATAAALGVLDRFDPQENIRGGVQHLRYLLDRYQGNVPLALAAYNAGEGAVDAYQGIPPYPETREYVRRVLRFAGLGADDPGAAQAPGRLAGRGR